MDKKEFLTSLAELLDLEPGSLTGSEEISSLESWDSLAIIGIIALADEKCGITIPAEKVRNCSKVDELFGLLSSQERQTA